MDQVASNRRLLSLMPQRIRILASADLPDLEQHREEWIRFLWQRGMELDYQFGKNRSERQSVATMTEILDLFEDKEYSPEFVQALKKSLYDVLAHYDDETSKEAHSVRTLSKRDIFPPLKPIDNSDTNDGVPLLLRTKKTHLKSEKQEDRPTYSFKQATLGLVTHGFYAFYAFTASDLIINGYDNSYTKRAVESLTSAPQNTPSP